jgi:hypothetical protein
VANQPQEKQVETVTMSDGRKVDFAGKRKMLKEVVVNGDSVSVRFDWRNGNTVTFPVPTQHVLYAAGHGYAQKLGDTVAGLKDEHGNPASEDDMQLEVEGLAERLQKGDWNAVREGGGFAGLSILAKALVEVYPAKSKDDVKAFLASKSTAEKQALRKSSKLAPIIQRLEGERDAKSAKVDTEALLGQLA